MIPAHTEETNILQSAQKSQDVKVSIDFRKQ